MGEVLGFWLRNIRDMNEGCNLLYFYLYSLSMNVRLHIASSHCRYCESVLLVKAHFTLQKLWWRNLQITRFLSAFQRSSGSTLPVLVLG